jgi:hypothetical protein
LWPPLSTPKPPSGNNAPLSASAAIRGRVAGRVDRPTGVERFLLALIHFELAAGHRRRREVEDEVRFLGGGNRIGERVRAEHDRLAEGWRAVAHRVRRGDADQVVLEREHRVIAGDAEMVGITDGAERAAVLLGLFDDREHRPFAGGMSQSVARIEHDRRRRLARDGDVGLRFEFAAADAVHIVRFEARDAVGFDAAQVGGNEYVADRLGIAAVHADLGQHVGHEALELFRSRVGTRYPPRRCRPLGLLLKSPLPAATLTLLYSVLGRPTDLVIPRGRGWPTSFEGFATARAPRVEMASK